MMAYTGVGSRKTPDAILRKMAFLGRRLGELGFILRSGGADGADSAFERGADEVHAAKQIYLPWPRFNGSDSPFTTQKPAAFGIAAMIHPKWDYLKESVKKLHARNAHQVLGPDLDSPSMFVVCWTPQGGDMGGTRTAIVLARRENIPVFNLANESAFLDLANFLREKCILKKEEV